MARKKTIAVIGGGSAGFSAARKASALGARVLFFMGNNADRASLCVNTGCMPSKAMFEPIDAMHHARRHGWLRVEPIRPEAYLGQIVAWKDREIARFRAFRQQAIRRKASGDFRVIRADARFIDANTLEAEGKRHRADAIIIATGSETIIPPIDGLPELRDQVWTNEEILANTELPESLAIVGAGAIGLEFSLRYARLGSAVTLLARTRPLSEFPPQFGDRLARIYELEGVRVVRGARPVNLRRDRDGWFVLTIEGDGGSEPIVARRVLIAAGRRPALGSLSLDAAGIEIDGRGHVPVDGGLRVAGHPHIFIAGDAGGRRLVVHHAHIEAGIAAENAVTDGNREWSRLANLQVVFSDPEFGFAGLDRRRAEAAGHRVVAAAKESRLTGKLHLAGDDHGFGEVYADADDHRLLGAGLLCRGADDLIHLPAYMIEHRHTIHEAERCEFYHPTRSEILSGILDRLGSELKGDPFCRALE